MGQRNQQTSRTLPRIGSSFNQELPFILISVVIGVLFAMIIGVAALDLFSYGLRRQLFILAVLSGGLGIVCYLLLTRSLARSIAPPEPDNPGLGAVLRKTFLALFFLFPLSLIFYRQLLELLQILRTGQSSDFIGWLPQGVDNRVFFIQAFLLSCTLLLVLLLAGKR